MDREPSTAQRLIDAKIQELPQPVDGNLPAIVMGELNNFGVKAAS